MLDKIAERFKIWIYKQCQHGREAYYTIKSDGFDDSTSKLNSSGISFTLYQASGGGLVVEVEQSSEDRDHSCNLYIIPVEADIGQSLSRIITLENLKK